ncbi:MAG: type II toxin-antitoxin system HicB family antitoxin [Fimbriimonadaceae bacterium]|nr:MAG: type II toxin-antitoxin system HicB family antitoxin [Fimbriimonadaceae bacterium]
MKWRIVLEPDPETGEFAVWCPELPGCVSSGMTENEAKQNIKEAIQLYLEESPLNLDPAAKLIRSRFSGQDQAASCAGSRKNSYMIWFRSGQSAWEPS